MSPPEHFSKCACQHCGGRIEYPSHADGRLTECPHCKWPTYLGKPPPSAPPPLPPKKKGSKRALIGTIVMLVFAGLVAGVFFYLKNQNSAPSPEPVVTQPAPVPTKPLVVVPEPPPDPWHGLVAGPVQLENGKDGHLVYAVGILTNTTDKQRFGVKVSLDVFDGDGQKIGSATDYAQTIEPSNEWRFKALVIDRKAKSAKVASVKED